MRILTVSDEEATRYFDFYRPGCLREFDLILACGDLSREYLEFLVTMARCPLFYVKGNHDESLLKHPPEGCVCLDDRIVVYRGIRFLGLGGSHRYRESPLMFTEQQMRGRIFRLLPQLIRHKGFDVLVTHAPARHLNDENTPAHQGFACFHWLLKQFSPKYFLHGHIHMRYNLHVPRRVVHGKTIVINACEYDTFDYEDGPKTVI